MLNLTLLPYLICSFGVLLPLHVQAVADAIPLRDTTLTPPGKRYPVTNDLSSIKAAYSQSAQWEGRAVAIEGTIRSIDVDTGGHPSIELVLGTVGHTTIWATWPLTNNTRMDSFFRVHEKVRVLGWVRDSIAWSKVTHLDLPRQNPMTLLPICLVKVRNSDAMFDSKYVEYCEAWRNGHMPPDMRIN